MNRTFILVGRVFAYVTSVPYFLSIVLIPVGVLNIIAGNKLGQVEKGELTAEEVQGWAIYLIFTTLIGGIFALLGLNNALPVTQTTTVIDHKDSVEQQLKDLKRLFEQELITKEEYNERRERIINSL